MTATTPTPTHELHSTSTEKQVSGHGACSDCGRERRLVARKLCHSCYDRHRKAGTLDQFDRQRQGVIVKDMGRNGTERLYRYIWQPDHPLAHADGYVAEHRLVAWEHGILTDPSHQVHHLNHDTLDNRPENLSSLTPTEHSQLHSSEVITNQHGVWPRYIGPCEIDGCELQAVQLHMCSAHVTRYRRYGDPLVVRRATATTVTPYVIAVS